MHPAILQPGTSFDALETPAALIDLDRLHRNIARLAAYAGKHKLALRPHIKTHKATTIAAQQVASGAVGVTCATPAEAMVMSAVTDDILLAYPLLGPKLAHLMDVPDRVRLTVGLDSAEAIEGLAAAALAAGRMVRVYVEIDVGMHRVGVTAWDDAIALARLVREHSIGTIAGDRSAVNQR